MLVRKIPNYQHRCDANIIYHTTKLLSLQLGDMVDQNMLKNKTIIPCLSWIVVSNFVTEILGLVKFQADLKKIQIKVPHSVLDNLK